MVAVKTSAGWQIRLESGKLAPKLYGSKEEAEKRIAQMEMFKHMKENVPFNVEFNSLMEFTSSVSEAGKIKISGTAVAQEKSMNGRTYTDPSLLENHMQKFNVIAGHKEDWDNPDHNVGEGSYIYSNGILRYEATVMNTSHHPDIVEQVSSGLLAPSVQGNAVVRKSGSERLVEHMRIPILALVNKHTRGVQSASIDSAIAESIAKIEEENSKVVEAEKMAELDDLKAENAKLQEALSKSELDKKKIEDEKKAMMMKEAEDKKKAVVESILKANSSLKESELMEKTIEVLEVMESYEKKSSEAAKGAAQVKETINEVKESEELNDIIVSEADDTISMGKKGYEDFGKSIRESIYR